MPRPKNQAAPQRVSLTTIIWANIVKWQTIRGMSDTELGLLLRVQRVSDRRRSGFITGEEMERVSAALQIEP